MGVRETANRITPYLRRLKEKDGRTQSEIAEAADVNANTIGKYFSGIDDDSANFEIVRKLVASMGGSLDELAGLETGAEHAEKLEGVYRVALGNVNARLTEKDARIASCEARLMEERRRAMEEIQHERKRAHLASVISYVTLGLFVILFFMDFLMPTVGWIQR